MIIDMMTPFSDNVIFFDTEFTTLNPDKGQLMSIGLVKMTGEELYLELAYDQSTVEPWVQEHVVPTLTGEKVDKTTAQERIRAFFGDQSTKDTQKPFLVSYVNQFDAIYWYKLFDSPKNHPAFWIPIDFASILFAFGYKPDCMGDAHFLESCGVVHDQKKIHNALYDAKVLATVYRCIMSSGSLL